MNFEKFDEKFPKTSPKLLKKGDFIYKEGELSRGIYYIKSGIVGLYHLSENGKETFLRIFGPKNILGHRSYFANENYHASSVAITDIELSFISQDDLEKYLNLNIEVLRFILKSVAQDLGNAELRMSGRHDKTAANRIIESIIFLKLHYPNQIWTRKQIADYSGSTFETVTRVLNKLEKDGYIIKKGRDFNILSIEDLIEKSFLF